MNIHHELTAARNDSRPLVLAIGFFDGVHRGHREILRALLRLRRPGYRAGVLTFENHPASFLRPEHAPALITTLEERVNLLARTGIDELYLVPFDERIARLSGEEFLEKSACRTDAHQRVGFRREFSFWSGSFGRCETCGGVARCARYRGIGDWARMSRRGARFKHAGASCD